MSNADLRQAVLAACDADDWTAAAQALADHDGWLRAGIASGLLSNEGELAGLLAAQQQLGEELQRRLAECADQIGALNNAGRGIRAYRGEGGS
jgi:hypothetical protein